MRGQVGHTARCTVRKPWSLPDSCCQTPMNRQTDMACSVKEERELRESALQRERESEREREKPKMENVGEEGVPCALQEGHA